MKRILLFTMMCLFGLFSLNAQETSFSYDFEDGTLTGWRVYQGSYATGDNWKVADAKGKDGSKGIYSASVAPAPGGFGGIEYTPNNYVVTTNAYQITASSSLSWYMAYDDEYGWPDEDIYQVVASEDGSNFNTVIWTGNGSNSGENTVSLSEYAGKTLYLGFYHYIPGSYGNGGITLDNIALTGGEGGDEPEPTPDPEPTLDLTKQYRVKLVSNTNSSVGVGQYLTIESYSSHATGPVGGVALKDYAESNAQIFTLEDAGNNTYYFRSADGYYIYCQSWNVDAYSTAYDMTALGMTDLGDGTFYLMNGTKHFKVEYVNNSDFNVNGNYPFCDAPTASTTWTLEAVDNGEEPEPTPEPEGDVCTIEFILSDQYSDGWDGSTLTVSATDGTSEVLTLESGKKSETYSVEIVSGSHATITYHPYSGSYVYPTENSFVVRYQSGLEIYSVAENTLIKGEDHVYEFDVDCAPKAPESPVVKAKATETTIVLTWDAVIGAESYKVYRDAEQLAEGLTETTYTITGLTPKTEYTFSVIAANEVGNSEPTVITAKTKSDNLEVVTIEIGEESDLSTTYSPVYDYNKSYSVSQTIYTSNEIGVTSGTITSISYKNYSGNNNTRNIAVYLKNVDRNNFATKEWETLTSDLCVYDGNFTFGTNDWVTIEFTDEFEYDGGNLLVCVVDKTGTVIYYSYDTFSVYEVSQTESESRAVYGEYKSYGTPINPLDLTNTASAPTYVRMSLGGTTYSYRAPLVKFEMEVEATSTPEPELLPAPQNLVATVNGQSSITLTWDAVDGAEDYYVYKDGQMWANTSGATTYTEEGLAAGTEYCFAVQAAGAAGDSELSEQVCATTESIELAENEIVIGTATTKYYSPFLANLKQFGGTWFEVIYKSEEIGQACTISELAFSYNEGTADVADINIYLAEVEKSEHANPNDFTAESELKLVYSGTNVAIADEAWETFVLDTPFVYSGENNLVVIVSTLAESGRAIKWDCYEDANTALIALGTQYPIEGYAIDKHKPVLKLTLGEGGEGGDDEPAEITHRLVGIYQNEYNNVAYTYESETSNIVTEVVEGYYKTVLEYNEDGQIVKTTYAWVDSNTGEMDLSQYTLVTYTYADGVLASYKEEIVNSSNPSSTEYTFTYEEDFVVKEWPNAKETYAFEDGRLVEKTKYYYDKWAETPDFVKENMVKYEYDENGNCVTETQYSSDGTPRSGVDYFYDMTIAAENVATFAYPHEFLPAHANLVTKAVSYSYQEDWQTGEVSKSNFEVKKYNYDPEVVAAPMAPLELEANVLSDTQVSLTWVSVETAESFNVYCNGELAGNATETYFTVEGLTAATEYTFVVKGVNGEAESEASNEATVTTMQLVNIVPNAIAFGDVKMGEFWTETSTGVEVKIDLLGKTITSIATDNDFFRVPATINLTEEPVTFKVDYKKSAEAGEYTGNLVVTLSTEETVTIPLSATAYNPVAPDVFELAQEIEFVEGAYTDAPDFATLHDDYNLPNEAEGNNPDAVYTFTLDTESVVNVEVTGENAVYATYKAFGEEEGPTAANAFFGEETILKTSFSYDFESADLSDFTIVDNDEFKDYTWTVENGSLVSYSFVPTPEYPYYIANDADERIITNKAYAITANSVLTLDFNVNGRGGNFNFGEAVFIEVTQDGETFTQVGIAYDEDATHSYEFMSKRINLGAKFAELGLEYGEYQIVLHHNQSGYDHISVDNFALTERANVYPAGTYYLVAAAPAAFEVNVEVATQEMPVAPKAYRLVSAENYEKTTYVYDETDVNRVVKIESEGSVDVLEYNTDGTLAGYKTIVSYEDPELGNVEEELGAVSYVYENGRIVSYSETVQTWQGPAEVQTEITYNAEGKVETVLCADYETVSTFAYNAEGLVSEMATGYLWDGEAVVGSKEVYTYENGKLVKLEYMAYDDFLDDGSFYVAEEVVYTYDENGNCVKAETYSIELDEETEEEVRSLYKTVESYYNTTVLAEDVYTFEYPHFAFTNPAKPATVNVLTKDMSFITGYDFDGNYGNHSHVLTVYNYDPEILSAPYAPFNLTAEATGESTVALTWEAYADAETFVVYNGTEKVAEGIEGFEYTVEGLTAATEYCFTVKAVNTAGESVASNEACATTEEAAEPQPTVPAAPTNVRATATGPYEIIVEWDAVDGATKYALYCDGEKLGETEGLGGKVQVEVAEETYCFTVTAINEVGESEHSEKVCVTTLPDAISELEASFNIYPNPVSDKLYIETEANVEAISIYTVTGTLIYKEVDFNSNTIDVSEFNGGVYIMKLTTDNGEIVKRFIKK